jgi:hypothetical protein
MGLRFWHILPEVGISDQRSRPLQQLPEKVFSDDTHGRSGVADAYDCCFDILPG